MNGKKSLFYIDRIHSVFLYRISETKKREHLKFWRYLGLFVMLIIYPVLIQGQYVMNGDAVELDSSCYSLTEDALWEGGSIMSAETIDLGTPFCLSGTYYFGENDFLGADGIVFMYAQTNDILGQLGGYIGYTGISPSFGWEVDDFYNGAFSDPSADHMAITRDGYVDHSTAANLVGPITISNVEDGLTHSFEIEWNPATLTFTATLDTTSISYTGDIVNEIFGGNSQVYYGFSAATGIRTNSHQVCITNSTCEEPDPCEELIKLIHACEDGKGSIVMDLGEDEGLYDYHWEPGGQETLNLNNLDPGIYTFVFGKDGLCKEECRVEILDLKDCEMDSEIEIIDEDESRVQISLNVTDKHSGKKLHESSLNIAWSDGAKEGLVREINIGGKESYKIGVEVSGKSESGLCCEHSEEFNLMGNKYEGSTNSRLIVNEINSRVYATNQYIELLVLGDQNCDGFADLRGYIIDDNNGELIPGNEYTNEGNKNLLGINSGCLVFSNSDVWKQVPNGSLIVVYDAAWANPVSMPTFDPTDANNDGVYVLSSEVEHLLSKTTTWNKLKKKEEYIGKYTEASWSGIQIDHNSDGIQVRDPKGKYLHGISMGDSGFQETNNFPLWISDASPGTQNCSLVALDYRSSKSFRAQESASENQTPGLPNSKSNEALIMSLRDCNHKLSTEELQVLIQDSNDSNQLIAYPNPFLDLITINYYSKKAGLSKITISDLSGRKILRQSYEVENTWNKQTINFDKEHPSGVYILQVDFPSGESRYQRMIKI